MPPIPSGPRSGCGTRPGAQEQSYQVSGFLPRERIIISACRHSLNRTGSRLDGAQDFRIGAATAQVPRKPVADFCIAWIGVLAEQRLRHQYKAGRAIAALKRAAVDKGLLDWVEPARLGQTLDGYKLHTIQENRQRQAARYRLAIDEHRAATTQALSAAFARSEQGELCLQHLDDILVWLHLGRHRPVIECEADRSAAHVTHPRAADGLSHAIRATPPLQ